MNVDSSNLLSSNNSPNKKQSFLKNYMEFDSPFDISILLDLLKKPLLEVDELIEMTSHGIRKIEECSKTESIEIVKSIGQFQKLLKNNFLEISTQIKKQMINANSKIDRMYDTFSTKESDRNIMNSESTISETHKEIVSERAERVHMFKELYQSQLAIFKKLNFKILEIKSKIGQKTGELEEKIEQTSSKFNSLKKRQKFNFSNNLSYSMASRSNNKDRRTSDTISFKLESIHKEHNKLTEFKFELQLLISRFLSRKSSLMDDRQLLEYIEEIFVKNKKNQINIKSLEENLQISETRLSNLQTLSKELEQESNQIKTRLDSEQDKYERKYQEFESIVGNLRSQVLDLTLKNTQLEDQKEDMSRVIARSSIKSHGKETGFSFRGTFAKNDNDLTQCDVQIIGALINGFDKKCYNSDIFQDDENDFIEDDSSLSKEIKSISRSDSPSIKVEKNDSKKKSSFAKGKVQGTVIESSNCFNESEQVINPQVVDPRNQLSNETQEEVIIKKIDFDKIENIENHQNVAVGLATENIDLLFGKKILDQPFLESEAHIVKPVESSAHPVNLFSFKHN